MFGNRDIPFHGDYNWISLATDGDGLFGYASWTDDRNVVPGQDPRELEAQGGFDDGFDVLQCRDDLADSVAGLLSSGDAAGQARCAVRRRHVRERGWPGPGHLRHLVHDIGVGTRSTGCAPGRPGRIRSYATRTRSHSVQEPGPE